MVLPIYKVISLVIRVFSKPLVTYIKQAHIKNQTSNKSPLIRKFFVGVGNLYNKGESMVNRKFMKIQSQYSFKPLNEQVAIQKGVQFMYEILFYSLVIGLPLYQMNRASNQAKAKSQALDAKLKKINDQLEQVSNRQKSRSALIVLQPTKQIVTNQVSSPNQQSTLAISSIPVVIPNPKINIDVQNPATHAVRLNFADHRPHNYRISFVQQTNNQGASIPRAS